MSISDRDCLIAHCSEIAAESARLNALGADVSFEIMTTCFDVSISSSVEVGPYCRRVYRVWPHQSEEFLAPAVIHYGSSRCSVVTHTWTIFFDAPLDAAEPAIEQIFRHFNLMASNLEACAVREVAA